MFNFVFIGIPTIVHMLVQERCMTITQVQCTHVKYALYRLGTQSFYKACVKILNIIWFLILCVVHYELVRNTLYGKVCILINILQVYSYTIFFNVKFHKYPST
jgi:hypothetical protein